MKKLYSISAVWREKDVDFLNKLNISRNIEKGMCIFSIEEGDGYDKIINRYSKKDSLFKKIKPKEFEIILASVIFTKEELNNAKYYAIQFLGSESSESRYPRPYKNQEYELEVFNSNRYKSGKAYEIANKKQIAPFQIKKPKWKKKEVCFNLGLEYEYTLFKKEFYQEVLAPLGLKAMEVLDYKTGKPLEDTIQLVIPLAKSKLLLENSAYDIHSKGETGGYKQYAVQTLYFFPPFEKEFDFHICYSQEEFYIGHKKIIISKEFCNLLVEHKIINYDTWNLTPLKN